MSERNYRMTCVYGCRLRVILQGFTCKYMAEATEKSILRKGRDDLCLHGHPLINIVNRLCPTWYILCVKLQINRSKLQLEQNKSYI